MIGTIYDRLAACVDQLTRLGIDPKQISVRGHPEAIRPFALCFDRDRYPDRSKREIKFLDTGGIVWRGSHVYQDGKIEQKDRVWICIAQLYVIVVEVGAFPRIDDDCPTKYRVVADKVIRAISPRAAP